MAVNLDEIATIDAKEAARVLGINRVRLYRLIREGAIPAIRIGRSVRFRVSALRAWMDEQEQRASRRHAA
ncbi:MAG: helix-turn-helix domain-containing protein [Limnochordaceae bacterium]|nr:helix-turn-helix domain-containing protein [Limnochordaceae bacterium]